MTTTLKSELPILFPMFEIFDKIGFQNKMVGDSNYLVVGQVCIDKAFRGQGILGECYKAYRNFYCDKYDFAITEIAASNPRSIKAHEKIGFENIHSYKGPDGTEWIVVAWDWNDKPGNRKTRKPGNR